MSTLIIFCLRIGIHFARGCDAHLHVASSFRLRSAAPGNIMCAPCDFTRSGIKRARLHYAKTILAAGGVDREYESVTP